jgi:uncharacterized RDD family membrane protein YckC
VYVPENARASAELPASRELPSVPRRPAFAGFWLRAVAYLIDTLIMSPVVGVVMSFHPTAFMGPPAVSPNLQFSLPQPTPLAFALVILVGSIYYAAFEGSAWQATPGKRLLKLYVTDLNGQRITYARAAARSIPTMIFSSLFPFVHLLAGFTEKKQSLQDILAKCLVLRRP